MDNSGADSRLFEEFTRELLEQGASVRFRARGASMSPAIRDGEVVKITPVIVSKLRKDDIVLAKSDFGFRLHRIVCADHAKGVFITRGDCGQQDDPALTETQILGLARAKEVRVGRINVEAQFRGVVGWALRCAARGQNALTKALNRVAANVAVARALAIVFLILLGAVSVKAQVALDSTSSASATFTASGTNSFNFNHVTTTTASRILLVGVSMNISAVPAAQVTGVTYGGTPLTSIGSQNDAGNTQRVEMWYLLAPASGTQTVVVTVNSPSAGPVGVVAGATTFTDVDQTVPLGPFVSASGANAAYSQLNVPSVVNGMVLDTLSINGNETITIPGWQNRQWNQTSAANANGVTGSGSSRAGAPSLPYSETFNANSNWSMGAISINPSTADIAVTTTVNDVELGQNSTYTVTVTNNGPSAANDVTLTDTFAATNLSLVSYTPSAGTNCTLTTTINCTLPTPFASGATATLTVTVSTSAAGYYPNTATISDSGTPPDPNTGNNSYVALAPVLNVVCSTTAPGAGGTLGGVINAYYPGRTSVAAGAISIPVGARTGTGTIRNGSLLLVIQMQNASISTSNSVAYGNGYTGAGFTAINGAGNYEYVTATGGVNRGSVPIKGAGSNGGLVFSYTASAASATQGQSTYQVVLVPQYSSATLSSTLTAAPWNGSTGGILALDVSGVLTLNNATVSVDGLGFRGGAGMQLIGGYGGANTDYLYQSPTAYTGAAGGATGVDAPKGEGVAGTPMWVESNATFLQTTTGYPSGTAGTDGSMARGAPANAGGGGTDADPSINDQNAGGGGGANGGAGGFGGDSWNTNLADGGEGGAPFPATIDRVAMGGGGGAGTRNNSDGDDQASSGASGGGIIFIRADSLAGTATLTANGSNAYNGTANDAGGGGGAGGTIVILSASGGEGGLTLQANGGSGGNAWQTQAFALTQRHGPGGGGGGGVIFVSGAPASLSVSGGADGLTLTPGVSYGSTSGASGTSVTNATLTQVTGIQSSAVCTRGDLAITKTHVGGNLTRGLTATYTIGVSNVSLLGAIIGLTTVTDMLPTGLTPTAASGTGWTCSIAGQTVSCTRSNTLAVNSSYPNITITASVLQSAPATVANTATVSNAGDLDPLNNTATDTATVVSSADMAILKTGTPNPVAQGATLTYTLAVTNNGPSNATNVTVSDALPSAVAYSSYTTTQGSCTYASATTTVTCLLGAMNSGGTATINILTIAQTPTVSGPVANTATVTATESDPNISNNTSTQNPAETITYPTAISLQWFTAHNGNGTSGANSVVLTWKTGGEARNLGFNVYRELNGDRLRVNSSLIAGSALLMSGALPKHSGRTYAWIDSSPGLASASYWLEDVDVNGTRTMHGPVAVQPGDVAKSTVLAAQTRTFAQLSQAHFPNSPESHFVETVAPFAAATTAQLRRQFQLAAHPAVKIFVQHEGWYRITQPDLVQAGLSPNVDPATLHLYAEAVEQPMQITGARSGAGGFGPQAAINFYGTGIDTVFSGTRVYWLVAGEGRGARIPLEPVSRGSNQPPASYVATVELRQHTTYFAALLTQDGQNFFGPFVSTTPEQQTIFVPHLDTNSTQNAQLEISLQGIVIGFSHDVAVVLNGSNIGQVSFTGQEKGHLMVPLSAGLLQEGSNIVTLTAQNGDYDTSLVEYIRITYPHKYVADSDQLKFTGWAGEEVVVSGFSSSPVVLDITNPASPVQLMPRNENRNGDHAIAVQVPWTTTGAVKAAQHTLLAVGSDRLGIPVGLSGNHLSNWHSAQAGADIAMITYDGFAGALRPLVVAHAAQRKSSVIVPVSELYDEFNFGEHSPYAIRNFLRSASQNWKTPPQYLLLNGRASFDPRNYLGVGDLDLVPTDIFPSSELMTASDDWFSDFSNTGMPTIATGRIPATTLQDDQTAIAKIAGYERTSATGAWTSRAIMVADRDDSESFTQDSATVQAQLPTTLQASDIFVGSLGTTAARQQLIDGINSGQVLVNYLGHGSEDQWSGADIFDTNSVGTLTNGSQLPVFLVMDCLNGFFQDVYTQPLAVALLLAPDGGAVAVLASSGLNQAAPQTQLDQLIAGSVFGANSTVGESILKAKSQITDEDVRRTFVLFGDPAMQIKQPAASH